MIVGILLIIIGFFGFSGMWSYISNDQWYTYNPPLTSHETAMLTLLSVFIIMICAGIITVIFSIVKKNNQDMLSRIERQQSGGKSSGVCPSCGLNISAGTHTCPKCGFDLKNSEE